MVVELIAGATFLFMVIAEVLHRQRVRKIRLLAFGPSGQPAAWTRIAPMLRVLGMTAVAWGLSTLLILDPKVHDQGEEIKADDLQDLILVLDVSPSMRLQDAGIEGSMSRSARAAELMRSFYSRIRMSQFRTSVVACYTGAKPVVEKTSDPEVIRNILTDLPMHFAFRAGPTDLISGITEAGKMAASWRPHTATLIVVSDGDTIPTTGMPPLPSSISHVLVIGVGDPENGKFIDGHRSRQDTSSLRQLATRLGGDYHDGNINHVPSAVLNEAIDAGKSPQSDLQTITRREVAIVAVCVGSVVLAFLPLALHWLGNRWLPGSQSKRLKSKAKQPPDRTAVFSAGESHA